MIIVKHCGLISISEHSHCNMNEVHNAYSWDLRRSCNYRGNHVHHNIGQPAERSYNCKTSKQPPREHVEFSLRLCTSASVSNVCYRLNERVTPARSFDAPHIEPVSANGPAPSTPCTKPPTSAPRDRRSECTTREIARRTTLTMPATEIDSLSYRHGPCCKTINVKYVPSPTVSWRLLNCLAPRAGVTRQLREVSLCAVDLRRRAIEL